MPSVTEYRDLDGNLVVTARSVSARAEVDDQEANQPPSTVID